MQFPLTNHSDSFGRLFTGISSLPKIQPRAREVDGELVSFTIDLQNQNASARNSLEVVKLSPDRVRYEFALFRLKDTTREKSISHEMLKRNHNRNDFIYFTFDDESKLYMLEAVLPLTNDDEDNIINFIAVEVSILSLLDEIDDLFVDILALLEEDDNSVDS